MVDRRWYHFARSLSSPGFRSRTALASMLVLALGISSAWAETPGRRTYRAYSVPGNTLDAAAEQLRNRLERQGIDGEVVVDSRRQRVLLGGVDEAHEIASELFPNSLAREMPAKTQPASEGVGTIAPTVAREVTGREPIANTLGRSAAASSSVSPSSTRLQNMNWRQLLAVVQDYVPTRLAVAQEDNSSELVTNIPGQQGEATLRLDTKSGDVKMEGDQAVIDAWMRVFRSLDETPAMESTRMKALGMVSPESITRVVELLRMAQRDATTGKARWGADVVGIDGGKPRAIEPAAPEPVVVAQADDAAPPAADGETQPPREGEAGGDDEVVTQLAPMAGGGVGLDGSLLGSVQIEFVEGLGAIIIRGRKPDVDRVMQIIGQLENLSAGTEPSIELLPLEHVNSQSMSDLVTQLNATPALAARVGTVSITPLIKPNSLLLIGRPEGVKATVDLVKRLDQPVEPSSQFQIYPLKHMSAGEAASTVSSFFANRTGLGPRVQAQADFRTNSLIVYASARDFAEVRDLLTKIDVTENAATSELRVFKLRNALAEELAPVLQSTLRGESQAGSSTAGQAGTVPGLPGAPAAGSTNNSSSGRTGRSSVLTMVKIDTEGNKLLRSGILTEVTISADVRANSLLVTAPTESMDLIETLVKQLDALPTSEAEIKVFTIVNGDATILTQTLQQLFGQSQQGQQANQGPFGQGTGIGAGDSTLIPLRFSTDPRTNSIIATGSGADLNVVEAILLRLDEEGSSLRKSRVYRLLNAPAQEVATAINEFLNTQRQLQLQIAPDAVSQYEQIEREVVVVPELVSNSLIISATPRYFNDIAKIVEELDERPPMVLIQVLIAEVSLDNLAELGVELGIQDSLLFDRSSVSTGAGTGTGASILTPGFNFNNQALGNSAAASSLATREKTAGQGLTNFSVGRSNSDLGYGGLVLSASSESISVLIRALQESSRLDILSRPQVMTLNNQPAFILVGSRVPRIDSTQQTVNGTINSTVLENVGLLLGVTPRISPDGLVVMEIDAEKSELGPTDDGIPISINAAGEAVKSPIINTTQAQTTVSARSGQTVILGGLITKSRSTITRKVPYLADIPVLGNLFRYDSVEDSRTELLIIMTPYIVRKPEDADALNLVESERMSWCLADVIDVHGDVEGFVSGGSSPGSTEVIYPDRDPTAQKMEAAEQLQAVESDLPLENQGGVEDRPAAPEPAEASDEMLEEPGPELKRPKAGLPNGPGVDDPPLPSLDKTSRLRRKPAAKSTDSEVAPVQYLQESPRQMIREKQKRRSRNED